MQLVLIVDFFIVVLRDSGRSSLNGTLQPGHLTDFPTSLGLSIFNLLWQCGQQIEKVIVVFLVIVLRECDW